MNPVALRSLLFLLALRGGMSGLLAVAEPCLASPPPPNEASPSARWRVGDTWHLAVKSHLSEEVPPRLKTWGIAKPPPWEKRYDVFVAVVGTDSVNGADCWKLDFYATADGKPLDDYSFRLFVGREDQWPRRLICRKGGKTLTINPSATQPLLADTPPGLPWELMPLSGRTPAGGPNPPAHHFRRVERGAALHIERGLNRDGKRLVTVSQEWARGAKWWSEFRRSYGGRVELTATLLTAPEPPPSPRGGDAADPPATKPGRAAPPAQKDSRPAEVSPLASDTRLQVPVNADLNAVPLLRIIELLSGQTSVALEIDPSLAPAERQVGSFAIRGVAAWRVMDSLTTHHVKGARWEVTPANGYRLTPVIAATPEVDGYYWLTRSLVALLALSGVLGFFYLRKRKGVRC